MGNTHWQPGQIVLVVTPWYTYSARIDSGRYFTAPGNPVYNVQVGDVYIDDNFRMQTVEWDTVPEEMIFPYTELVMLIYG